MTTVTPQRLIRECVALFAILAMLLGPLSLAVSRGLSAQERVNIAAGLTNLPICAPADSNDGLAAQNNIDCDHCLPAINAPTVSCPSLVIPMVFGGRLVAKDSGPSVFHQLCCLPPATGPPALI